MIIFKYCICGYIYGTLYGVISYYLLTNLYRQHAIGLIACGIQGAILGASISCMVLIMIKCRLNAILTRLSLSIIGTVSGVISSLPFIIVTLSNATNANILSSKNMLHDVIFGLALYCAGSAAIGMMAGLALHYKHIIKRSNTD